MRKAFNKAVIVVVAGALVLALAGFGYYSWSRSDQSELSRAVASAPAGTERLSWTDWAGVRRELGSDVDARSTADELRTFLDDAYDADLSSRSALLQSAPALQASFGFSPASAEWELFSQSADGAVITLRMPDDTDFEDLADRLTELGYPPPENDDGVWAGGPDLLSALSANLTPELAYVVLDRDEHLVMASDQQAYLEAAVSAATGDDDGVDGLDEVTEALGDPLSAAVYSGEYACGALAMGQADTDDQARGRGAGRRGRHRRPVPRVRDGRAAPRATYESRWSSPTTTRPASTPTAAPPSRRARPSARVATSPTASRCARPARTGLSCCSTSTPSTASTSSATSPPAPSSSPPVEPSCVRCPGELRETVPASCASGTSLVESGSSDVARLPDNSTQTRRDISRNSTQRKRRRRRLLVTTATLERAMAAPAIIGLRRPAAASGRAARL